MKVSKSEEEEEEKCLFLYVSADTDEWMIEKKGIF